MTFRTLHKATAVLALCTAGIIAGSGLLRAQQRPQVSARDVLGLEVLPLRQNFYMIAGAGANIGVQVGADGVVVVDAGSAAKADAVVAAIKAITAQPIRYVIDTSAGLDHVGGNETLSKAGQTLFNTENNAVRVALTGGGAASIISTEKVLLRLSAPSAGVAPLPTAALPTEPFFEKRKAMFVNGEGIEILQQPAAHADGDTMVLFRRSDVVMAGEVFDTTRFPLLDLANGGSIQGEIDALNRLMELAIPSVPFDWRDDGTLVVPGHGRVSDQIDVADYRDMVTIVRDRVRQLVKEGKTLAEVRAAAPTQGFTKRYGSDRGPWTTAMFVDAVYTSLTQDGKK